VFHVEHLIVSTLTPWACSIIPRLGDHLSEEIGDFQHNVPRGTLLRLQSFTGKCGRAHFLTAWNVYHVGSL